MPTMQKLMTAEELLALPGDGRRHELIEGELRTMSPMGSEHSRIGSRCHGSLYRHVTAHGLGEVFMSETGFLLATNPDTVRAPNVAFVRQERVDEVGNVQGYWPGPPDLAVEIISPNDRYSEVDEKVETWLEFGTRMVIVIDPRRYSVKVYRSPTDVRRLTLDDLLSGEEVIPGWSLAVRDLFPSIRPSANRR